VMLSHAAAALHFPEELRPSQRQRLMVW
jgi:hypothetical protein